MGVVAEYVSALDEPGRSILEGLRARAIALVPEAEEGTSYGMAALRYRGRPLIAVMETKAGYSVYPFSPAAVAAVLSDLTGFEATKGGIKFTAERPLPDGAFEGLVTGRRAEIDAALKRPSRK